MKAGRKLDALVATHVFGLKNVHEEGGELCYEPTDGCRIHGVKHYSTEIAAAWHVIEYLDDWKLQIDRYQDGDESIEEMGRWSVNLWKSEPNGKRVYHVAHGMTFPQAVCLVALLAVGVSVYPICIGDSV